MAKSKSLFINGRFLTQPVTGVQRYAIEVCKALDQLIDCGEIDPGGTEITILVPPEPFSSLPLKHIRIRQVGRLKGNLWEQIELPWHARSGLLFSPCNIGPVLHFNQVVTIHDASVYAVPEAYSWTFRLKYQTIYWILGRTAKHVFTVSEFSKKELIKYCGFHPEKLQVVYEGSEHILAIPADEGVFAKHSIGTRPYVLAVSSNSPHKNFASLMKAVELLGEVDFDVVIAGGTFSKVFQSQNYSLPDSVKQIGYVTDSELRALYEHAACFVYPSYYEGFGLPPIEAMRLGCPVIVSNTSSMPEVCGEGAVYCVPRDTIGIVRKICLVVQDNDLQSNYFERAIERSKQFSWQLTARIAFIELQRFVL